MGYALLILLFAFCCTDCANQKELRFPGQYYQINGVWYYQVSDKIRIKIDEKEVPDEYKNGNEKE